MDKFHKTWYNITETTYIMPYGRKGFLLYASWKIMRSYRLPQISRQYGNTSYQAYTEIETAKREIKEETSIDVIIDPTFRETVTYSPKKDTVKVVVYFLARAKNVNFSPQEDEIAEIRWVDISYAGNILSYENDRTIVSRARNAIRNIHWLYGTAMAVIFVWNMTKIISQH